MKLARRTAAVTVATSAVLIALASLAVNASPNNPPKNAFITSNYDKAVSIEFSFASHIEKGMPEQDVFIERLLPDRVFRPTNGDRKMSASLFASARPLRHDPFDDKAIGPWPKGKELGITLGEWLKADGKGSYTCKDGKARLTTVFTGLVPNGVYTMWHYFMAWPVTKPFNGTYDLPLGTRDGAQAGFRADADGKAKYEVSFKPCLQLTGEQLASGLAIAWHSDGKTYGPSPGDFGANSHVQLFVGLPKRSGI